METPLTKRSERLKSHQWNALYLLSATSALVGAVAVAIQPLLLDQVFGIPFEKEGEINADVQVVAEIIAILCVGFFSFKSDRVGRVPVIFYGFLLISIGAFLLPMSYEIGLSVGIGGLIAFYFARILITMGADTAQTLLLTLVGDASDFKSRPRLMSNATFMIVFGGTVLSAIMMQVAEIENGILLITIGLAFIGLAGAWMSRLSLVDVSDRRDDNRHPLLQVWDLVMADPRMQLAFAAAFYTRMDLVVVSLFYSLWCISMADMVGETRLFATAHAAAMVGFLGAGVLLSIPLWRRFVENHSRIHAIGVSLSLASIGYVIIGLIENPYNWGVALPLFLIGVGHAGSTVTLEVLTVDVSPRKLLGSVLGTLYLIGSIGIIMLVQSGGYYFDAVGPRAPFILMGTGKLLVLLFASWLIVNGIEESADHTLTGNRDVSWKSLVFLTSALPFVWLVGRMLVGGYAPGGDMTDLPVGFINRYLGDWAFTFLIISLALRPIAEMTGLKALTRYNRMIGLYAFFYAVLHVCTYVSLEWVFDLDDMFADIYKRPFILLGLISFILLTPLALTSRRDAIRRLGGKKWKKLHKMVYVLNVTVALHFIFAAETENGEPYIYAALVALLLGYRYWRRRGVESADLCDGSCGDRKAGKRVVCTCGKQIEV